jgi:hypothetical protein
VEVRPGVVPLRPLGVGELLDGAITTMRRYPGPMLGLAAVFAVATQGLQVLLVSVLFRDVEALAALDAEAGLAEVAGAFAGTLSSLLTTTLLTWLATVILTGLLTVVVGQAVLGRPCTVGDAWRQAAPRLLRLVGITVLVGLVVAAPVLVVVALLLAGAALGGDSTALVPTAGVLLLAAIPATVWLYVRLAVASPALVLESTPDGRPIGVLAAMRRSGRLVTGAWWRTFGILLLVTILATVISSILTVPFVFASALVTGLESAEGVPGLGSLTLQALGGVLGATVTTPFTAAVTVLLYVDRRIRREGLDIELARAAGVVIPGRTPLA